MGVGVTGEVWSNLKPPAIIDTTDGNSTTSLGYEQAIYRQFAKRKVAAVKVVLLSEIGFARSQSLVCPRGSLGPSLLGGSVQAWKRVQEQSVQHRAHMQNRTDVLGLCVLNPDPN